jgi:hypothetical protein
MLPTGDWPRQIDIFQCDQSYDGSATVLFRTRPEKRAGFQSKKGEVKMRKLIAVTASTALCLVSISPAFAQANLSSALDAPRGAAATANFRVPFGGTGKKAQPTYGLSLTYGRTMASPMLDGKTYTRSATLADLRFDTMGQLNQAKVASFDLANAAEDRRMQMMGGSTWLWIALAAAAGVGLYLILDDDDDDDENP